MHGYSLPPQRHGRFRQLVWPGRREGSSPMSQPRLGSAPAV